MNDDSSREELLSDVVAEAVTPSFRTELLAQLLGEVRRSRARRQRNQRVTAAVFILIALSLAARFLPGNNSQLSAKRESFLVHSEPLAPDMIVATRASTGGTINTLDSSVALVEAIPDEKLFEFIGDDTLLALLAGRPTALIRYGSSSTELVFLNPADANGFQVH